MKICTNLMDINFGYFFLIIPFLHPIFKNLSTGVYLLSIFRCNMYVGLGYTLVARNVENQSDRKDLLSKAEYHYKAGIHIFLKCYF